MTDQRYPVLITGVMKYLVWVDAPDAQTAHQDVDGVECDWIEGEQPVDAWAEVASVQETADLLAWNVSLLPNHDAHVWTHAQHKALLGHAFFGIGATCESAIRSTSKGSSGPFTWATCGRPREEHPADHVFVGSDKTCVAGAILQFGPDAGGGLTTRAVNACGRPREEHPR